MTEELVMAVFIGSIGQSHYQAVYNRRIGQSQC
jgi:hypothetical protein